MGYVIVVDDDDLLAGGLCDLLSTSGHTAVHYRSAAQLRQRMMFRRADVILIDGMIPKCSGIEALTNIRADPRYSSIPIIMTTADRGHDALLAALRAGASDYMTKPFLPAELLARVDGVIAARAVACAGKILH